MIRFIVFSALLCGACCGVPYLRIRNVTLEKNKPLSLPENAGTHISLLNLRGILYADSLSQLNITNVELELDNLDHIEPGAVCSTPSLKSLRLYVLNKPLTVTKEILKNCEKLEALFIGGFEYKNQTINTDTVTDLSNLKNLTFYYVDVVHVTKEHFEGLSSLEQLTLKDCFIEEVDTDAFSELKNLRDLKITTEGYSTHNFNILSNIPLKLEKLTFGGVNGTLSKSKLDVMHLHLEAVQLNNIESGALCPTPSIKRLEIDFETPNLIKFTKDTFENCQNLEELSIKVDYPNFSEVEIEADALQNVPNLKKLFLENVKLKHISKDTFKNSFLLENLTVCKNNVEEVDSDAFSHFQHLKQVKVCPAPRANFNTEPLLKNTIKADKLTFEGLIGKLYLPRLNVRELFLQFDGLKEIESGAICSSPSLKKFSLKFTTDRNFVFTKDTLDCENLEELFLVKSRINPSTVQEEAFDNLANLKVLYLNGFDFNHVKRKYFKKLPSLEKLVLDHCFVEKLDNDTFNDLENLKILQISFNPRLTHIPENLFKNNTKLEELLLFRNEISDLTWDEFKGLPALTTLSVSENPIRSFNAEKIAENIPNLKNIDIKHTSAERNGFVEELKKKLNVTFDVLPDFFL